MELYRNLIDIIPPEQYEELEKRYSQETSLHAKIIYDLLTNPEITSEQIFARYKISEGTFNKTLTRVKDILWDFNARYIETGYDDIFVLRKMLMYGKIKNTLKFFNSLKKKFELTQQWEKLDCLYTEGLRYAQITGDETMASQISQERKENSIRLHEYTLIYSEIIPEMIKLEGFKIKKFDTAYAYLIENLYSKSIQTGHHLLIHNSLHLKYLLYARFKNTPENVYSIINAIKNNAEYYKHSMAPITYAIALNAYVNFLCTYRNFESPDKYVKSLHRIIHHGGKMAIVNFYYSMLEYSVFEKKIDSIEYWLNELQSMEDESKFSQYKFVIIAIKNFIEEDYHSFTKNFQNFYSDPSHLNFPDLEITLRLLEAILLIKKNEGDVAFSRLTALRIFMGRNVDMERYKNERTVVALLNKINEQRKDIDEELLMIKESHYRNINFISEIIKDRLL